MTSQSSARFHAWNAAGKVAWYAGKALNGIGLWLCGKSGYLDSRADDHRG